MQRNGVKIQKRGWGNKNPSVNRMRGEKLIFILTLTLVIMSELHLSAQNNPSDRTFKISESRGSAYDLLNKISTQTGSLFIYDSKAVDNKKRGRISRGEYTIEEAIRIITQDNSLTIKQEGEYILIYKPQPKTPERVYSGEKYVRMEGVVLDRHNGEPVVSATVSPEGGSVGTITNQEGRFRLTLPDSLAKRNILFSSMGYEQRKVSGILLTENDVTIEMMQSVIPLQEVIVRVVDPRSILLDAIRKRESNYHPKPLNITAFYREGIEYKSNLSLSEAVLKLYKSGLSPSFTSDQAKLLKMRKISTMGSQDTLIAKLRSTINAIILLDIMKYPTDFLQYSGMNMYNYTHTDITEIDGRRVYVFSFVQKEEIMDALFTGELYVDAQNHALVKAIFEVNPNHIRKFADNLIVRKSKTHEVTPVRVKYQVSYKSHNGLYLVNHIRGDLSFKVRKKGRLLTTPLNLWFEMANCKSDTENVEKFLSDQRLSTRDIFSDIQYTYDPEFWEHFNIIMQEEKIEEIIRNYKF